MVRRSRTGSAASVSCPPIYTFPDVGATKRLIMRSVVVLPHPEGPSSTQICPSPTLKVTCSTACTLPRGVAYVLVSASRRIVAIPSRVLSRAQSHRGEAALQREQRVIGGDCQQTQRKRTGDELSHIGLRDAAADECSKAARADICGDR